MRFLDEAKIYVRSGDGGHGCLSFRREKNVPFGGPDGGDGGRGGDVAATAVEGLNTLVDFRYRQHVKARPGGHGMGSNRTGAKARDAVIKVPVGTQILEDDKTTLVADLTRVGERVVLARGGGSGRGNAHFTTSVNRAPRRTEPGRPGEERWLWLRLKLIADTGLVGLPNAGKSTLLAAISRARPRVADYPFTTLHPHLGVAAVDGDEIVVADIPGLIEGASGGAGLGTRFLGHVERCPVLIHLVDGTAADVAAAYRTVRAELAAYGAGLADKPELVALNKCDAFAGDVARDRRRQLAQAAAAEPDDVFVVSGHSRSGVDALLRAARERVVGVRGGRRPPSLAPVLWAP